MRMIDLKWGAVHLVSMPVFVIIYSSDAAHYFEIKRHRYLLGKTKVGTQENIFCNAPLLPLWPQTLTATVIWPQTSHFALPRWYFVIQSSPARFIDTPFVTISWPWGINGFWYTKREETHKHERVPNAGKKNSMCTPLSHASYMCLIYCCASWPAIAVRIVNFLAAGCGGSATNTTKTTSTSFSATDVAKMDGAAHSASSTNNTCAATTVDQIVATFDNCTSALNTFSDGELTGNEIIADGIANAIAVSLGGLLRSDALYSHAFSDNWNRSWRARDQSWQPMKWGGIVWNKVKIRVLEQKFMQFQVNQDDITSWD